MGDDLWYPLSRVPENLVNGTSHPALQRMDMETRLLVTGASARAPRRETVVPVSMSAMLDRMLGLEQPDGEKVLFTKLVWTYLLNLLLRALPPASAGLNLQCFQS